MWGVSPTIRPLACFRYDFRKRPGDVGDVLEFEREHGNAELACRELRLRVDEVLPIGWDGNSHGMNEHGNAG
jgi:hypothetical protein